MIGDWIEDHMGWILTLVLVALVIMIGYAACATAEATSEACMKMWNYARTPHDSLEVTRECEKPKQPDIQVVPVYVPIQH